jgi:hypothetical protein
MSLYAYCLSDEAIDAIEPVVGLAGAKTRLIRHGGIVAVVSDFSEAQITITRENVLGHERVVRRVLAEATPLPFRFGTIIGETKLESYLDSQHDALKAQLERVRGCVEMSVKVIWDLEAVRDEALQREEGKAVGGAKEKVAGRGAAFLETKRREILGGEALKERAEDVAKWLDETLAVTARETRETVQPTQALVVSAAYLVERARLEEYGAALRRAQAEREELHFLTSGAWPPYSFTNISS